MSRNIALSLGLDEGSFNPYLTHPGCSAVVAHYPPMEPTSTKLGLDPHTDNECKHTATDVVLMLPC